MHESRRPLPKAVKRVTVVVAHYPNQPNKEPLTTWVLNGHLTPERAKVYVLQSEDKAAGDRLDNEFRDPKYTWYSQQTVILED